MNHRPPIPAVDGRVRLFRRRPRRNVAAFMAIGLVQAAWGAPITVEKVREFRLGPPDEMVLPTDVAVARSGRVFVVDGVNDRVVEFDAQGNLLASLRQAGSIRLASPIGAAVDGDGNLWIADTGNGRVVVRAKDGTWKTVFSARAGGKRSPPEITDAAPDPTGRGVWLVDNANHQLLRVDTASGAATEIGARGSGPGQLRYPFLVAADAHGAAYVTDVINARVQALVEPTVRARVIGRYGVEAGELYRPKGVAIHPDGNVWVTDGSIGVVQVFAASGEFVGVARNREGEVYRFDAPCGMAIDDAGDVYVVEMAEGRVIKLRIVPSNGAKPGPAATPRPPGARASKCTLCHIEWMPGFAERDATPLISAPVSSPDDPLVSRNETCLSCHDGSVVDSRRRVWIEHGHRKGVAPPEAMTVPPDLPLVDGMIACRTCHSAHSHPGAGDTMADAIFLRVTNRPEELCVRCHADVATAPASHRISELAAASTSPESGRRSAFYHGVGSGCLVCHAGHGSSRTSLLRSGDTANELCVSCHESTVGVAVHHPLTGPFGSARPDPAVSSLHTSRNELTCLTCHKMHGSAEADNLLIARRRTGALCSRCHESYDAMFGTSHDLRIMAAGERNTRMETAAAGGPCSACHLVHRAARDAAPAHFDPEGRCVTCHQSGGCAPAVRSVMHPHGTAPAATRSGPDRPGATPADGVTSCRTCHNPHAGSWANPAMLRSPEPADPAMLCTSCHTRAASLAQSLHNPQRLAGFGARAGRVCSPCHSVHAAPSESPMGMWAGPVGSEHGATRCTGCHNGDTGIGPARYVAHPPVPMRDIGSTGGPSFLPLVDERGRPDPGGVISCNTCHLSHGRTEGDGFAYPAGIAEAVPHGDALLRAIKPMLRPYQAPNLCSSCHGFEGLRLFLRFHALSSAAASTEASRGP